jgi:serine/threonine-protein kinase/endoribonuclease IRE1
LKEDDTKKYRGPMPSEKEVFLQLATGLAHIHETGLIHRDLKPQNVLIHVDNGEKVQLKWADFGLSKPVNENGSCSMSGINKGTDSWYAPEILKITAEQDEGKLEKKKEKKEKKEKKDKDTENNSEEKDAKKEKKEKKEKKKDKKEEKGVNDVGVISSRLRATVKSDVFGEGLIFGYFLSGGVHPYGSKSHEITSNILNDKPIHLKGIYFLFFLNQKNRIKLIFILRTSSQE